MLLQQVQLSKYNKVIINKGTMDMIHMYVCRTGWAYPLFRLPYTMRWSSLSFHHAPVSKQIRECVTCKFTINGVEHNI